jgi:hypothetical protein
VDRVSGGVGAEDGLAGFSFFQTDSKFFKFFQFAQWSSFKQSSNQWQPDIHQSVSLSRWNSTAFSS